MHSQWEMALLFLLAGRKPRISTILWWLIPTNHIGHYILLVIVIHPSMPIFIFRCCTWHILSGWQHLAMPNTSSPCIFVLCVNATQATIIDTSHHRFRPCLLRPSLLSNAKNRKVCDRFDTGCGPLYMAIPSESPTAKDQHNILNAKFLY